MLKNILKKQNMYIEYIDKTHKIMTHYTFDIDDMKKTYNDFYDKLKALKDIKEGDKISFDIENRIYIDRASSLQCVKRWYYGETREVTYDKLSFLYDEYNKFLMMVLRSLYNQKKQHFFSLADTVYLLNKDMVEGLNTLRRTYVKDITKDGLSRETHPSTHKLIELMDAIIEVMRQFEQQYYSKKIHVPLY